MSGQQAMMPMKTLNLHANDEGMIHDAQYDYYGKRLATCSNDGKIHIFDTSGRNDGNKVTITTEKLENPQTSPIWKIAWAHPRFGTLLASCSFDKSVAIHRDMLSQSQQGSWSCVWKKPFDGSMNYLQFSPWECGLHLAAASSSGKVWLISQRQKDSTYTTFDWQAHDLGVNSLSWQPYQLSEETTVDQIDKSLVVFPKIVTGSCDKTLKVWSISIENDKLNCKKIIELKDIHQDWIRDVAWCPAIGNSYDLIASCSEDSKVVLWKLYPNQTEDGYDKVESIILKGNFEGPIWRLSWSLTGNMLAVSAATQNNDNQVVVYQENDRGEWEIINSIDQDEDNGAN
ncbi:hypothetical protein ABPG72_010300 [Tetrahymena utriculariae]